MNNNQRERLRLTAQYLEKEPHKGDIESLLAKLTTLERINTELTASLDVHTYECSAGRVAELQAELASARAVLTGMADISLTCRHWLETHPERTPHV